MTTPRTYRAGFATVAMAASILAAGCLPAGNQSIGEQDELEGYGLLIDEQEISAVIETGAAYVDFPITRTDLPLQGAIPVTVEVAVTDLDGNRFGMGSTTADLEDATSTVRLEVPGLPADLFDGTLGEYNISFSVRAPGGLLHGTRSLFSIVKRVNTVVVGSDVLVSGGQANMRITVTDQSGTGPVEDARVEVDFVDPEGASTELFSSSTDSFGISRVWFPVLPAYEGAGEIAVRVYHESGSSESRHAVTVQRQNKILLTTDKPLYQPGQTMHLRALAMDEARRTPAAGQALVFEVRDGKGNKVMKKQVATNSFGVASETFTLARQVNMGRYQVSAILGDTTQQKTVTVERYALPKFKVDVIMDRPYYLPAQTAHGTLDAQYTFGQPVSRSDVQVRLYQYVAEWSLYSTVDGETSEDGSFEFDLPLPSYLVGLPLEQGGSLMRMEVQVTDGAGSTRVLEQGITISQSNVVLQAIAERPLLAPGIENLVWLVATSPSGSPVQTTLNVQVNYAAAIPVVTNDMGLGELVLTPASGTTSLYVSGADSTGAGFSDYFNFSTDTTGADVVLLRTDASLLKVGDSVTLSINAPRAHDRVYLDAVRDGQTVLEEIVQIEGGTATRVVDLGDDMAGTLVFSVYYIADSGDIIRDQRVVYVESANALRLTMSTDRGTYRPAETATLSLEVRNIQGTPTQAAVGLTVVDEAVFALSEYQPGMERTYFNLEDGISQPAVTVYGWSVADLFPGGTADVDSERAQSAARVLFAAAAGQDAFGIYYSSRKVLVAAMLAATQQRVNDDLDAVSASLESYIDRHSDNLFGTPSAAAWVETHRDEWFDPWGQKYESSFDGYSYLTLRSAGADELWATGDDLTATNWVDVWANRDGEEPGPTDDDGDWGGFADAASDSAPPPDPDEGDKSETDGVRVREYFPETLLVEPSIITDVDGRATIEVPLADSITTWRVSGLANAATGELGSSTSGILVFQPFFIDVNFPATLTLGDTITVPVGVYNYSETAVDVTVSVESGDWFGLLTPATQSVTVEAMSAGAVPCTIRVDKVGWHYLQANGVAGGEADAVRRAIEVLPSGQLKTQSRSDMLEGSAEGTVATASFGIPPAAIDDASELLVKVYPGMFSQAVEGLDSILSMPSGCFEQTSSSTYPNVIVLEYLQATGQTTPEVEMKAREYINLGYQRLLTYEVSGGGFSWFGEAPAHNVLTAYGLMEFSDMAKVHPVDEAVISRTAAWLAAGQGSDGSWTPTDGGIAEGAIDDYENNVLRTSGYVMWALASSGYDNASVMTRAATYIEAHRAEATDDYSRAILALALLERDADSEAAQELMDGLAGTAIVDDAGAHWEGGSDAGLTYSTGSSHAIETTALAALAFMNAGSHIDLAQQAMNWLVRNKDSFGNWETTQATVYAIKDMTTAAQGSGAPASGAIQVFHNDVLVETIGITAEDYDVFRQVDLKEYLVEGTNDVRLVFAGEGTLMFQVSAMHYEPWAGSTDPGDGTVAVDVTYDHTSISTSDTVTATVDMVNNTDGNLMMVMLDLGVPPGFTVLTEDLDALVTAGTFSRYELTGRQIIIYFEFIPAGHTTFGYRLRADSPIEAEAPASRIWLYYTPGVESFSEPIAFRVE